VSRVVSKKLLKSSTIDPVSGRESFNLDTLFFLFFFQILQFKKSFIRKTKRKRVLNKIDVVNWSQLPKQ